MRRGRTRALGVARSTPTGRAPTPAIEFARWIVWEDEGLLAVDKPAGVLSQGGEDPSAVNLVDLARAHLGVRSVGVLHRIDRNVSGLVLIAKHSRAASAMSRLFRDGAVQREYRAIVRGHPPADAFTLDAWLAKDERAREVHAATAADLARMSDAMRRRYRPARTEALVVRRLRAPLGSCAELSLRPITGRSHQLRAHLAHAGLPIVGDPKYGVRARGLDRPLLHAARIAFTHPRTGTRIVIASLVPWNDATLLSLTTPAASTRGRFGGVRERARPEEE